MLPESMPPHKRALVAQGRTVIHENKAYTLAEMSPEDRAGIAMSPSGDYNPLGGRSEVASLAEFAALRLRAETAEAEVERLSNQPVTITQGEVSVTRHDELLKALLPTSQTEVKGLSKAKLALVAKYVGVESEGKEDEAVRAEVFAALKGND